MDSEANTSGGASVGGNVNTGGGDFVGGDKVIHGDSIVFHIETSNRSRRSKQFQLIRTLSKLSVHELEFGQDYFEQFTQPTWLAFNIVHEDYKSSFRVYLDIISQENADTYQIIKRLVNDSWFSVDLRVNLNLQREQISSDNISQLKLLLISDFINALNEYFFVPNALIGWDEQDEKPPFPEVYHGNQIIRRALFFCLLKQLNDPHQAESQIHLTFQKLQNSYSRVAEAYYKLKKAFI